MKKIITIVVLCMLAVVMICGCTRTSYEAVYKNDSAKEQIEIGTSENANKDYSTENEKNVDSVDIEITDERVEDEQDGFIGESNVVIDISTVKNTTDYSYEVEVIEGDNGMLIADIAIKNSVDGVMQRFTYQTYFDEEWLNMYIENGGEICKFVDFNFDGYPDAVTQLYGAVVNQWYKVWLYNPKTKGFENSEEYETQVNPRINIDKKLVLSTRYNKGIPSYELSHVEDGHLAYQGSIIGEISDNGNITYVERMYGYINEDGEFDYREVQTYEEVNSVDDLDKLWSGFGIELVK